MKIKVVCKAGKKGAPVCPWMVDYPPDVAKD
jgi:hypothetical protein